MPSEYAFLLVPQCKLILISLLKVLGTKFLLLLCIKLGKTLYGLHAPFINSSVFFVNVHVVWK